MYIAVSKQTEKKEGKEKEVSMAANHLHTFRTSYQSKYYLTDTHTVLYTLAHCKNLKLSIMRVHVYNAGCAHVYSKSRDR